MNGEVIYLLGVVTGMLFCTAFELLTIYFERRDEKKRIPK